MDFNLTKESGELSDSDSSLEEGEIVESFVLSTVETNTGSVVATEFLENVPFCHQQTLEGEPQDHPVPSKCTSDSQPPVIIPSETEVKVMDFNVTKEFDELSDSIESGELAIDTDFDRIFGELIDTAFNRIFGKLAIDIFEL